jgi:hypothetical protein
VGIGAILGTFGGAFTILTLSKEWKLDLSLPKLMTMSENEFDKLLNNSELMEKVALDNRHVQIIHMRIMQLHYRSIREFNQSSAKLSQKIYWLTWILVLLTVVLTFLTEKMVST